MKIFQSIILILLVLIKTESKAQLVKVFESDSLKIYTNKNGENIKPSVCKLKFVSEFHDSVVVYFNNKRIFSKFLKPDSSVSTDVDLTAPYINLPLKNKKAELKILLLNEKITIKSSLIKGYRYLYVYKEKKKITLDYENSELSFY